MSESKPHIRRNGLTTIVERNLTRVVVFYRDEADGMQRYVEYHPDALRSLVEQLQAVQEDHEATTERLRERRDENTRLIEQFEVADLAAWLLSVDFAPELKIANPKILKDEYLDRARKKLRQVSNPARESA